MSYLSILTTCLVSYLIWAVVLSDSLFHRLWSLSLFSLFLLSLIIYTLPVSTYTIPLSLLALVNFLLCIALSPLQVFFRPPGSIYEGQERLTIYFPNNTCSTNNEDSKDALFVECVPRALCLHL
jgi:hypothetical protein